MYDVKEDMQWRTGSSLQDLGGISHDLTDWAVDEPGAQGEAPGAPHIPASHLHGVQARLHFGACPHVTRLVHEIPRVAPHICRSASYSHAFATFVFEPSIYMPP